MSESSVVNEDREQNQPVKVKTFDDESRKKIYQLLRDMEGRYLRMSDGQIVTLVFDLDNEGTKWGMREFTDAEGVEWPIESGTTRSS